MKRVSKNISSSEKERKDCALAKKETKALILLIGYELWALSLTLGFW
jgi:hypothetical protein